MSTSFLFIVLLFSNILLCHAKNGMEIYQTELKKCLPVFLKSDYQFIPINLTLGVTRCIYGFKTLEEFIINCPDREVYLFKKNDTTLDLRLRSDYYKENMSFPYVFHSDFYYDKLTKYINKMYRTSINVAYQVEIDMKLCNNGQKPYFETIILQMLTNDAFILEYGFLFLVKEVPKVKPKLFMMIGFVMVPLKSVKRSMVIDEEMYNQAKNIHNFIDKKRINSIISCDLNKVWKDVCKRNNGSQLVLNLTIILWYLILMVLYQNIP